MTSGVRFRHQSGILRIRISHTVARQASIWSLFLPTMAFPYFINGPGQDFPHTISFWLFKMFQHQGKPHVPNAGMCIHPIFKGVQKRNWHTIGSLYRVAPTLNAEANVLPTYCGAIRRTGELEGKNRFCR